MSENTCQRCKLSLHHGSDPADCRYCDPLCPIWGTHGHFWNGDESESQSAYLDTLGARAIPDPTTAVLESFRATPGCRYVHKKGGEYIVLSIAEHSETGEDLVVYRRISDQKNFARPKAMFEDGRFKLKNAL